MKNSINIYAYSLLALSLLSQVSAKQRICAEDPFADPAHDLCNPLKYIPHRGVNVFATVLYSITAIGLTFQHFRHRCMWMLVLTIGAYAEAVGLGLRLYFRVHPQQLGAFIGMNTLVVLSPCLFLAADYVLLGRLVAYLDAAKHLKPLRPALVSRVFVLSDVVTFLIQGIGAGMAAKGGSTSAKAGAKLFLVGLALQLVSFALFTCLWGLFGYRVKRNDPYLWRSHGWKVVYWVLGFTCICYLIRSVLRTVELGEGFGGYLSTHEPYFLLLDTLPLWLGITSLMIFWPGRYIRHGTVFRSVPASETGQAMPLVNIANK
ncbi:hypothetical protein I302_104427 [Kwoniella bestiolae CBS 10118]|uniref:Integral membrane protein n=1 Tax=Kwoniella bestiolae CBS 10118 TaxID=1296100 RepID=A0A1B9GB87_9TREE|nr:hypothetical protein I302_03132 [Kwoniella bestiolae CBS 10118]OCF28276.1 hypothetical protein I302_03132 [Kwoniella bestiolae CBS 10118]